jgi:hypothetical protein
MSRFCFLARQNSTSLKMVITMSALFERYKNIIKTSTFSQFPDSLLLEDDGKIRVYYSPFEYINEDAKLVLVGITPGKQQGLNALNKASELLQRPEIQTSEVLRLVKSNASFSGTMRPKLVSMLDFIGINQKLGIASCSELFSSQIKYAHFTSVLKMPVQIKDSKTGEYKDYSGSTPSMVTNQLLQAQIKKHFLEDVKKLPNAMFLALGSNVAVALDSLVKQGLVDDRQIIGEIPHPSGANVERVAYFLGQKQNPSEKVDTKKMDANKKALLTKLRDF